MLQCIRCKRRSTLGTELFDELAVSTTRIDTFETVFLIGRLG